VVVAGRHGGGEVIVKGRCSPREKRVEDERELVDEVK